MKAFDSIDNSTTIVQSGAGADNGTAIPPEPQTAMSTELGGSLNELELNSSDSTFDALSLLSQGRQFVAGDWNPNNGAPALPNGYSNYKVGMRWRITDDGSWSGNSDLQAGVTDWEADDWATVDINGVLRAGDNVVLVDPQHDHYRGVWPEQGSSAITETPRSGDYWTVTTNSRVQDSEYAFVGDVVLYHGGLGFRRLLNGHGDVILYVSDAASPVDYDLGTYNNPMHLSRAVGVANSIPQSRGVTIIPVDGIITINYNGNYLYRPITIDRFDTIDFVQWGAFVLHEGSAIVFDNTQGTDGNIIFSQGGLTFPHPLFRHQLNISFKKVNITRTYGWIADCIHGIGGMVTVRRDCTVDGVSVADDPDFSAYFRNISYHTVGDANIPRNILCNLKV